MKKVLGTALSVALLLGSLSTTAFARKQFVTIGTGGVTGVYYPTGGAISKMLNNNKDYNIKATVESTAGSVYNINSVLTGDLDFGMAQSDRQYQAAMGLADWEARGAQKKLRSVFSVHPESVTLVAAEGSGIDSITDLKGKKVNIGAIGSGQLQNSLDLFDAYSFGAKDMKAENVKPVESPGLLQDERIDAFFYTVGHPSGAIKEATSGRVKVKIIDIVGPEVDALIAEKPYYAKSVIAVDNYPNSLNKEDITSVGVKATLVTSSDVKDDVVYALTKEVFDNFEEFKTLHPAYKLLTKQDMLQGLSAPIHKGALKYYKEAGLDKYIKPELMN